MADEAGAVDVLVNNAGVIFYAAFPELSRASSSSELWR